MYHELEERIVESWLRLRPALLANPTELETRLSRRRAPTFIRPPRPW